MNIIGTNGIRSVHGMCVLSENHTYPSYFFNIVPMCWNINKQLTYYYSSIKRLSDDICSIFLIHVQLILFTLVAIRYRCLFFHTVSFTYDFPVFFTPRLK